MRIVTVTKQNKSSISKRINLDFINYLEKFNKDYYCVDLYHNGELFYDPKTFYETYKPDVVICHEHAKELDDGFFAELPCTKIMIAVDFHKLLHFEEEKDREFYKNNNFDLVFHRHWITEEEKEQIPAPTVWLPYAVNSNEFYPAKFEKKNNKIVFVGTRQPEWIYWQRNEAIRKIDSKFFRYQGRIWGTQYSKMLRSYKLVLNSAELNSPFGKFFEIMASGSVPFSAPFCGGNKLFDEKFWFEYEKDCNDINERAKEAIKDDKKLKKMSKMAYNEFINKHTFNHRVSELYNNIKRAHKRQSLKKKWEE